LKIRQVLHGIGSMHGSGHKFSEGCLSTVVINIVAPGQLALAHVISNANLSMIVGGPFNIQSIPETVVTRCLPSALPKIYINIVKSTVLPHPPTKDLSVSKTFQLARFFALLLS
jgi:hypothetical protein